VWECHENKRLNTTKWKFRLLEKRPEELDRAQGQEVIIAVSLSRLSQRDETAFSRFRNRK
jgi:hypothetical protein